MQMFVVCADTKVYMLLLRCFKGEPIVGMKRKTTSSLLNFSENTSSCLVSPHLISNIVFISNKGRQKKAGHDCLMADVKSAGNIITYGGELISSDFTKELKMGGAVLGAS